MNRCAGLPRLSRIFRTLTQPGSSHLASATAKSGLHSTATSKKLRRLSLRALTGGCSFLANTLETYHNFHEMLSDGLRYQLLSAPYDPPRARRGGHLFCEWRGTVKVGGYSDGPIPWPIKWGTRSIILCGSLVDAAKLESE